MRERKKTSLNLGVPHQIVWTMVKLELLFFTAGASLTRICCSRFITGAQDLNFLQPGLPGGGQPPGLPPYPGQDSLLPASAIIHLNQPGDL